MLDDPRLSAFLLTGLIYLAILLLNGRRLIPPVVAVSLLLGSVLPNVDHFEHKVLVAFIYGFCAIAAIEVLLLLLRKTPSLSPFYKDLQKGFLRRSPPDDNDWNEGDIDHPLFESEGTFLLVGLGLVFGLICFHFWVGIF